MLLWKYMGGCTLNFSKQHLFSKSKRSAHIFQKIEKLQQLGSRNKFIYSKEL